MNARKFDFIKSYFWHQTASVCSVLFQVLFSGSPQCFENPHTTRFYGLSGVSNNPWEEIPKKLIPLLQAVVRVLEENRTNYLSPESPGKREEKCTVPLFSFYFYIILTLNPEDSPSGSWKSDFGPILLKISLGLMSKLNWWKFAPGWDEPWNHL